MITISKFDEKTVGNTTYMYIEGDGLSTDTLPSTYAGKPIYNASSIFLMDTYKIAMYNQTAQNWQIKGTNV